MAKTRRHAQLSVNGGAGIGFPILKSGRLKQQTASRHAQPNVMYIKTCLKRPLKHRQNKGISVIW